MKVCFIDRSTKLDTVNDLQSRPRGGMVTSLFKVSDYLSERGHEVWVQSDVKEPARTSHGTNWVNELPDINFDFLVCNRGVSGFDKNAKHRILWTHDLPHSGFIPEPKNIKAFSVVFMSNYAERVWRDFYTNIGRSFLIPNGVDKSIFYPREKDLNYLIYASAPNRGLKRLPFIFDCIKTRVKRPVYMRAYSNLQALHPNEIRDEDGFTEVYKAVEESDIELRKPIPQLELCEELGKAGMMILPTDYPEICSNVILQSLASGTPVITTGNLGSAGEWIKHGKNGMLTKWHPFDYMVYQISMIRHAVSLLDNESMHRRLIDSTAKTKIHTWDEIGGLWLRMMQRLS